MSTAMSLPPQRSNNIGRHGLTDEKSVNSTSKLSVAQRARLQADEQSCNSVRVKIVRRSNSNTENSSLLGSIGRSLSGVIDQSVLGIPSSSEESEDLSSEHEPEERRYAGKAQSDTGVSEAVSKNVVDFVVGCLATVLMHVYIIPFVLKKHKVRRNSIVTYATAGSSTCPAAGLSQGARFDQERVESSRWCRSLPTTTIT